MYKNNKIIAWFRKLDDKPLGALEKESADFFSEYFEAARRGKRNENCFQYYGSCRRSLRDFLLKSTDDRGFVEWKINRLEWKTYQSFYLWYMQQTSWSSIEPLSMQIKTFKLIYR